MQVEPTLGTVSAIVIEIANETFVPLNPIALETTTGRTGLVANVNSALLRDHLLLFATLDHIPRGIGPPRPRKLVEIHENHCLLC